MYAVYACAHTPTELVLYFLEQNQLIFGVNTLVLKHMEYDVFVVDLVVYDMQV